MHERGVKNRVESENLFCKWHLDLNVVSVCHGVCVCVCVCVCLCVHEEFVRGWKGQC